MPSLIMKKYIFLVVIIFLLTMGISYFIFSKTINKAIIQEQVPVLKKLSSGGKQFDTTLPKTESCPLNGVKYSTQQRDWWNSHRPLGVMIENHVDARPQSGISFADITYEAVAEGGITRTLDIYYCQDAPVVGPVRSARIYFVHFLMEYGAYPLYAHVGGANAAGPADALGEIDSLGWTGYNDLNQFSIGFPTFWRDYNRLGRDVATEHTMYSTTSKLWNVAASRKLTNVDKNGVMWDANFVKYSFKNDAPMSDRPAEQTVHVEFWGDNDYNVDWIYDKSNNVYKRNNGGKAHIDLDTNKQLEAKDVVVLFMKQTNANDGYMNNEHLLYQDFGTGKADVFMDGKDIKATWNKKSLTSRMLLYNASTGDPIEFDAGKIWFTILPLTGVLRVQ